MFRCASPPSSARALMLAAAALSLAAATVPPAFAQTPPATSVPDTTASRVDDPVGNGIAWGALAGAGVGAGLVGIAYAQCDDTCDAPARLPMYAGSMAIGAGSGAAVGWLIDKLHKGKGPAPVAVSFRTDRQERSVRVTMPLGRPRLRLASLSSPSLTTQAAPASPPSEPARVDDPLTNGALIGAATGAGVGFTMVGISYAICADSNCGPPADGPTYAIGAAAGAGVGLLTGLIIDKMRTDPPVAVAIRADKQERGVRVSWRF